ncbi:pecanex-like protein 4 [Electrophorus electricus]|uniref:Pecanex-like protein n=1 Tax=Electrophorus electricus TaxID=8005 RepID=A0A4W4EEN7_ELEEL|nr:pecanex-like protein 4 [Electrophorus electricus]
MGPDVPLLNDYKQEFFWKRFPQTVLGGPRLKLGYCAPPYVYAHQLVLFLTPWLLGGVGTLLYQVRLLDDAGAGVLSGVLMLAVGAALQALAQRAARSTGAVQRLPAANNILADEEEVEFTNCVAPETVHFVVPGKRFMVNVILHTALAGVLCGLGTWYLLPDRLSVVYADTGAGLSAIVPVFALSWVTLCIGEYSLIVNTATETATFQPQDTYEITPLTRPLYILAFITVDLVLRCSGGGVAELRLASQVLHGLFVVLPLLWAVGMLSPLDALLLWTMEQGLLHALGGSPMATDCRLVLMFLASICVSISAFFIPSSLGVVLFTVAMGYLLSQDLTQIMVLIRGTQHEPSPHNPSVSLGWWALPLSLLLLAGAMTEAGLLHQLYPSPGNLSLSMGTAEAWAWTIDAKGPQAMVGWLLIALFVVTCGLRKLQGACVLGGLLLNPLYPRQVSSVQAFRSKSRGLRAAGRVRRVLLNLVCPLTMIAFLAMDASLHGLRSVSLALGTTRAFRAVWQSCEDALLQMAVVVAVRLAAGEATAPQWHNLGVGIQLILVSLASDRLSQFLAKLRFALTVLVTSWTESKQRRQAAGALLALNGALCPLLLSVVLIAALLAAPLLPLFTLPVFLVGFPRPRRSWPGTPGMACPCPDSVYYQQLSSRLAAALSGALADGALGSCSPGSHFLCRFQDRVVWITVLERGYGYWTVNIKGLELQETSCHTVEARRVDEVFEGAFDQLERRGRLRRFLNPHWGNALTPCSALPVRVYSDARNVLTGIVDSPDHLRQLRSDFLKTMVWVLLRHCLQDKSCSSCRVKVHSVQASGRKSQSSQHGVLDEPGPGDAKTGAASQGSPDSISSSNLRGQDSLSLSSFADWSDEDDLFGPVPARKPARMIMVRTEVGYPREELGMSLPGAVEIHSLYENVALASLPTLRPLGLGLGLPVSDRGKDNQLPASPTTTTYPQPLRFTCPHSESLSLAVAWRAAPLPTSRLQALRAYFPEDWFHYCLSRLAGEGFWEGDPEQVCRALQQDQALKEMYTQVALSCAVALGADAPVLSPSMLFRAYCGDAPWPDGLEGLRANEELYQLTLRAFRYSVKLLIDQVSLGPLESLDEMYTTLQDYHINWFIGLATERGWHDSILEEKPFLFSLGHDLTMGTYTGRVLSLQEHLVQVGVLNEEGVRGQWANLSWELLYATNDDEERYSIQAHPIMLRNLTVQAADPPLGYPVYSSAPAHLGCL